MVLLWLPSPYYDAKSRDTCFWLTALSCILLGLEPQPREERRVVITDRFVYIHMPKTGGTFVEFALRQLLSGEQGLYIDTATECDQARLQVKDKHQTVSEIPDAFRSRPIAFTVRPFDHHVSYYEFGWWKDHAGDTFDEARIRARYPHYPVISFRQYFEAIYDWELLDANYVDANTA